MSLGLAFAKNGTIYLAVESQGVPYKSINSKLFCLQQDPEVFVVCTGGLDHWHDVKSCYKPQPCLQAAAECVRTLLERLTGQNNDAHALVCGFVNEAPQCYRVDRTAGLAHVPTCMPNPLEEVQVVGKEWIEVNGQRQEIAARAKRLAEEHIKDGFEPAEALSKAINDLMPTGRLADCLCAPLVVRVIDRNRCTEGQLKEPPQILAFEEMQKRIFEFEELLRNRTGIAPVAPGSKLERAALAVMEMLATCKKQVPHDKRRDYREEWRRALSFSDMLRKILNVKNHPAFDQLWPHILLLLGDNEIAQNVWSPKEDGGANKVFELYAGLLVLPLCSSIDMDDPVSSSGGKNPDIIAEIDGCSWALACKVMHTASEKSFLDRIRDGINQINRCVERGKAQRGIVVISLKNVLDHDKLWPITREPGTGDIIYATYLDELTPRRLLESECNRYQRELLELCGGPQGFRDIFAGSHAEPFILVHLCTAAGLEYNGRGRCALIRALGCVSVDPLSPQASKTCHSMNACLHDRQSVGSTPGS